MPLILLSAGTTVVSADASALHSGLACREVIVAGHISNTVNLVIGGSATQALPLWSGTHLRVPVSNLNMLYAKTSAGSATVTWMALTGGREG